METTRNMALSSLLAAGVLLGSACSFAGDAVSSSDFANASKIAQNSAKGSFDGVLPDNWEENFTSWCDASAKSKPLLEGGQKFLRISVDKANPTTQFLTFLPTLSPGEYLCVVKYRSASGNSRIGVRQLGAPYANYWNEALPATGSAFVEKSFQVKLDNPDKDAGLFLYPALGDLDLVSIKLERRP